MDANRTATLARSRVLRGQRSARARLVAGDASTPESTPGALPAELRMEACPTCLACTDPRLDTFDGATPHGVEPAVCPTCGQASLEFGLLLAIDEVLGDLHGLARLDAAL